MGFELEFTDKEISAWGGMSLMKRMLDHIGFDAALRASALPQPGSNRGYAPEQLIVQFMLSVWCGANRFEHGEVTRHDPVLRRLFGFARMANFKAVMRLFRKFSQAENERVLGALYRWLFAQLALDGLTLDLDSTVMTRYGQQEGAARGYNPTKPGRVSHHPLMAFVSDLRMVANCWLRPGNSHTANNAQAFLDNTLDKLGGKQVALLRADSGFGDNAFLQELEAKSLHYIIALRLNQPLQRALVDQRGWWMLDDGIELVSFDYRAPSWPRARRVVGIRQHTGKREQAKGKTLSLFADDPGLGQYRFAALVTDLALPAQEIWRSYRGRADCENRIKELKYDFAADSFCLNDFWATEACLNVAMLAYNLMSLFRQAVLKAAVITGDKKDVQHTLKTLRYKLFAKAGYITTRGRKDILKLCVAMRQRQWLEGLWDRSKAFSLPVRFTPVFTPG
ncbi:MAG TPA: IS1380 family transposase [Acidiferrobacterales bacterium]|nr:IS1380 family transposase [Acidiferrobacterales bacterium]